MPSAHFLCGRPTLFIETFQLHDIIIIIIIIITSSFITTLTSATHDNNSRPNRKLKIDLHKNTLNQTYKITKEKISK